MVQIDNFSIQSDAHQFIIKENVINQDKTSKSYGENITYVHGYYCTFSGALIGLEKILTRRLIKNKDYTLKEAVEAINLMHKEIVEIVKENEKCQI